MQVHTHFHENHTLGNILVYFTLESPENALFVLQWLRYLKSLLLFSSIFFFSFSFFSILGLRHFFVFQWSQVRWAQPHGSFSGQLGRLNQRQAFYFQILSLSLLNNLHHLLCLWDTSLFLKSKVRTNSMKWKVFYLVAKFVLGPRSRRPYDQYHKWLGNYY